ncbi:MAG: tRNA 2-thiocytidine biosynthesis protein TtcA [Dysosmobacter sp.]
MSRELTPQETAERSLIKTYRKAIWNPFIAAVKRYELIEPGDRIAVCISGGKDSVILAKLMQELQRHTDQPFELVFLVMDPGYKPENRKLIEDNAALLGIPITIFDSDIFDVTTQRGEEPLLSCAPGCAGASCTPRLRSWDATRSPWATTFPTCVETTCHGPVLRCTAPGHAPQAPQQEFPRHGTDPSACIASMRTPSSHWKNYNHLQFLQCACRFTEERDAAGDGVGRQQAAGDQIPAAGAEKDESQHRKEYFSGDQRLAVGYLPRL